MGLDLPPEVLQAYGLPANIPGLSPFGAAPSPDASAAPPAIPPIDSGLAGAPGIAAPDPVAMPVPASMPDPMAAPTIDHSPNGQDYVVPMGAFGHPGNSGPTPAGVAAASAPPPTPPPAANQAPAPTAGRGAPPLPSPEQQFAQIRQDEKHALGDSIDAVADKRDAEVAQANDNLAAQRAYDERIAAVEKQRAAWNDEYTKTSTAKQAYMNSTLAAVDNYKLDQNKYMKQMGVGGTIGWAIAAVLSGLGQALQRNNGPNPVIGMLQDRMKQAIAAQMDERDQLKEKYGRAEHDYDRYQQYSASRTAQMTALEAQADRWLANQIKAAGYKSAAPMARANAEAEAAKLETSAAEKAQKSVKDATDYDMSKKRLQAEWAGIGISQQNANETRRHNVVSEGLTADQRNIEALKIDQKNKDDAAKLSRERSLGGELTPVRDAKGNVIGSKMGNITMKDGSEFHIQGTEPIVTAIQKKHAAAASLVATLDEIRKLGPEWLNNTANSDKFQRLNELMGDARLQAIAAKDLGVPTGHDIELAENFLGTSDPTRWKDSLAGIMQSRESIVRDHNVELQKAGLDKPWKPDDLASVNKAPPSEIERLSTTLKAKPAQTPEVARDAAFNAAYKSNGGDIAAAHVAGETAAEYARTGRPSPEQREALGTLKDHVLAGDPESAGAMAALEDIAKNARSAAMKDLAQQTLSEIQTAKSAQPLTGGVLNYDPSGYNPQELVNRFQKLPKPTLSPQ